MKRIIWLGSSYEDLLSFSKPAKQIAGYNLDKLQRGQEPQDWKPMISIGKGVKELRIHCENEYRVIYIAQHTDGIYILHAFVKKSQKKNQRDVDLAKKRFKEISSNYGEQIE
jgi:phage-related protein